MPIEFSSPIFVALTAAKIPFSTECTWAADSSHHSVIYAHEYIYILVELEVGALFSVLPFDFANTDRPWKWKALPLAFCNLSNMVPIQGLICQQRVEGFYKISFSPCLLYFLFCCFTSLFLSSGFRAMSILTGFMGLSAKPWKFFVRGAADVVAALRVIAWRFAWWAPTISVVRLQVGGACQAYGGAKQTRRQWQR